MWFISFRVFSLTVCLSLSLSLFPPLSHAQPSWVGGGAILGSNPHPPTHFGDHEWRPPYGEEADYAVLCEAAMVMVRCNAAMAVHCGDVAIQCGRYGVQ